MEGKVSNWKEEAPRSITPLPPSLPSLPSAPTSSSLRRLPLTSWKPGMAPRMGISSISRCCTSTLSRICWFWQGGRGRGGGRGGEGHTEKRRKTREGMTAQRHTGRTPKALLLKTVSNSSRASRPPAFFTFWKKASLLAEPTGSKTMDRKERGAVWGRKGDVGGWCGRVQVESCLPFSHATYGRPWTP